MRVGRRAAALIAGIVAGLAPLARPAAAQSITLGVPLVAGDSVSPAPPITVTALPGPPEFGPYSVAIELSLEPQFRTPFFVDASSTLSATFELDSLMQQRTIVYFRAELTDNFGRVVATALAQHPVQSWLRLVSPLGGTPTIVNTRTPRFTWSSPPITCRCGLFVYDLSVINTANGATLLRGGLSDTTFVFSDSLESNTSYRWQVHAHTQSGPPSDQITLVSSSTFVVASAEQPTFTLFYQNFPNPFGQGTRSSFTCFWFDLARASPVTLTIYDIRLHEVRHIVPGPIGGGTLPLGSYGRENLGQQTGCDQRLAWDGRDDAGRMVPAGLYLAVFEGAGVRTSKKVLYRGP